MSRDAITAHKVWFAEVRHSIDFEPGGYTSHQRPGVEGGPHFNRLRSAQRWCESTFARLIGEGAHPADLHAVVVRGKWTWHTGRLFERTFTADVPEHAYVCRSDFRKHAFEWTFIGQREGDCDV